MPQPRYAFAALLLVPGLSAAQFPSGADDGGLYLKNSAGDYARALTLQTEVDIDVTGIVAEVMIRQRFRNTSDDWVEGVYLFPLPEDAAVDKLDMQIGSRRIEGEIQEREQARQTYERARAAGQQASLVEQERPNLFTTSVANIAPQQEISIEIGFLQLASYDAGEFELRLPMTMTPRFVPGGFADAKAISAPFRGRTDVATHQAQIDVEIDAGMPLAEATSPSHALEIANRGRSVELKSAASDSPMDRDLIINWRIVADQSPRIAAFHERGNDASYLLLMFMPPSLTEQIRASARELVFVIDTSGSMGGNSIARARTALQSALGRLQPGDRFNVIEFNSKARSLFANPVALTTQSLNEARRFVSRLTANGGTNIAAALTLALNQSTFDSNLRQIVFITDGSVGNEAELFQQVRRDLGSARLFTVGIGAAPNTHFMRKAAEFGRGSYSYIEGATDVETAMQRLFTKLEHIALTDIEIAWPDGFEVYPERIPDLYHGEPIVVAARTDDRIGRAFALTATGKVGNYGWSEPISVSSTDAGGIPAIWARRKIESLLDQRLSGASEDSIRAGVIETALAHGVLSPFTSLVAVDQTPERTRNALLRRQELGNLLPAGSNMGNRFARLPGTATEAKALQLIGVLLAALLLGLIGIARLMRQAD